MNTPKLLAKLLEIRTIVQALSLFAVGAALSAGIAYFTRDPMLPKLILLFTFVPGIVFLVLGIIGYRQLQRVNAANQNYTQFQTGTAVTYVPSLSTADPSDDSRIIGWFGPVFRQDKLFRGKVIINQEINEAPENSLLFTQSHVIALMIGPDDVKGIELGATRGMLFGAVLAAPGTSMDKNDDFAVLYAGKWDEIMQQLAARPISDILFTHLTSTLAYAEIESAQIHDRFINPGVTFYLKNNEKRSFSTFGRKDLPRLRQTLSPYISFR